MSTAEIFTTSPIKIQSSSFYPRNYDPVFLFVKELLGKSIDIREFLTTDIKGGSTPPAYFFYPNYEKGIPFVKTSAISRHLININDLHNINETFHRTTIKRSITRPYDVIFSMTGKFMGKAAICPPTISELNMSQNSVIMHTKSPIDSAFLAIYLNSKINQVQVKGNYSITKQKFINQGKIAKLKILHNKSEYKKELEDYINSIDLFYGSIKKIKELIQSFNKNYFTLEDNYKDKAVYYSIKSEKLNKDILLPAKYRIDYEESIEKLKLNNFYLLDKKNIRKGNEIGSSNYTFEGIPFIKTSNILNFDVDYEPDYYCSQSRFNEIKQDIKAGDIIFTKDGKIGEVAIIQDNANIVVSGGFIKYRPTSISERYWLFLLLASKYGQLHFDKWTVIASTMAHLRKDFFTDFKIPVMTELENNNYVKPLTKAFEDKEHAFTNLLKSKENVLSMIFKDYKIS